jgi:hypothetical protein
VGWPGMRSLRTFRVRRLPLTASSRCSRAILCRSRGLVQRHARSCRPLAFIPSGAGVYSARFDRPADSYASLVAAPPRRETVWQKAMWLTQSCAALGSASPLAVRVSGAQFPSIRSRCPLVRSLHKPKTHLYNTVNPSSKSLSASYPEVAPPTLMDGYGFAPMIASRECDRASL